MLAQHSSIRQAANGGREVAAGLLAASLAAASSAKSMASSVRDASLVMPLLEPPATRAFSPTAPGRSPDNEISPVDCERPATRNHSIRGIIRREENTTKQQHYKQMVDGDNEFGGPSEFS